MQFRQQSLQHQRVDYLMAANPNTDSERLGSMAAAFTCKRLLEYIAENEKTPLYTLFELCEHEDEEVRMAVGRNIKVPQSIIDKLADDKNPDVRFSLAENPNLQVGVLKQLAGDENPWVASRAMKTLDRFCREEAVRKADAEILELIGFLADAVMTEKEAPICQPMTNTFTPCA